MCRFKQIHLKVRLESELGHFSGRALAQLASLSGAGMFDSESDKVAYLVLFTEALLGLIANLEQRESASMQLYELDMLSLALHNLLTWSLTNMKQCLVVATDTFCIVCVVLVPD